MILAIDPGNIESAWVLYDPDGGHVVRKGKEPNADVLQRLRDWQYSNTTLVVERIACYGMAVGDEVFETCVWTGRFIEAWLRHTCLKDPVRITRKDVKMHLCGSMRAKDKNVILELSNRYGGKKCKGTKKNPGPLYGIAGDQWQALAVAVTFAETKMKEVG